MDLAWSSGQPRDINSRRRATRRSPCTHEMVSTCRAIFRSHQEVWTTEDYHISWTGLCERCNIITFRNTGGTILNEFAGNNIEFGRVKWCASTVGVHVSEGACEQRQHNVDGILTRQCGCRQSAARETWTRACVAQRSRSGTTRVGAFAIRKLVQTLRTCQEQGESAFRVKSWRRVEVRHRQYVHG